MNLTQWKIGLWPIPISLTYIKGLIEEAMQKNLESTQETSFASIKNSWERTQSN